MLLNMTQDQDAKVRQAALWALATENRGDSDVLRLLEATLKDKANPARLRGVAAAGLGLAGAKAPSSVALLREALNDNDRFLQSEARTAIRNIEKAAADDKARSPE